MWFIHHFILADQGIVLGSRHGFSLSIAGLLHTHAHLEAYEKARAARSSRVKFKVLKNSLKKVYLR